MLNKKLLMFSFITAFLLLLAGCGQEADSAVSSKDGSNESKEKEPELTIEDVLQKSADASERLESYVMDLDLLVDLEIEEEIMTVKSDALMEITKEPLTFYQEMSLDFGFGEEPVGTKAYYNEQGVFAHETTSNQWAKFPEAMSQDLLEAVGQQLKPHEDIKNLQQYTDDFNFEEDEQNYILTLPARGEKFKDLNQEIASNNVSEELVAADNLFESLDIHSIEYEILVDKETFYPNAINMILDMSISNEDQSVSALQTVNVTYTDFDEVQPITIPQEVIDQAIDMTE